MTTGGPFTRKRLAAEMLALKNALNAGDSLSALQLGIGPVTKSITSVAAGNLFTIVGRVLVTAVYGIVTTVVQTQTCNTKLVYDPAGAGLDTDLCATVDLSAAAVGSYLACTGTLANAMVIGIRRAQLQQIPWILEAGTIKLATSATNTGAITWYCHYKNIDADTISGVSAS